MPAAPPRLIFETLSLLTPYEAEGERKARIGHRGDGGYVMIDRFRSEQPVYSFGVGDNVVFDLQLARRGHLCHLFDHTVETPPGEHENFRFYKEGISARSLPGQSLYSLDDHLDRRGESRSDLILKIDVEGAEWEIFAGAAERTLARCEQIVLEAHWFARLTDFSFCQRANTALRKLSEQFTLIHVHANNYGPVHMVEGMPAPDVLELSYIRSDLIRRAPSATVYPTGLDAPNDRLNPDLLLAFFPFLPSRYSPEQVRTALELIQRDHAAAVAERKLADAAAPAAG